MPSAKTPAEPKPRWIMIAAAMAAVLLIGYQFWPASKVTLDDDGYQVTMALYRICNQGDAEALAKLDETIASSESLQNLSPDSQALIARVRSLADSRDWDDAVKLCRQAMEDQVRR